MAFLGRKLYRPKEREKEERRQRERGEMMITYVHSVMQTRIKEGAIGAGGGSSILTDLRGLK